MEEKRVRLFKNVEVEPMKTTIRFPLWQSSAESLGKASKLFEIGERNQAYREIRRDASICRTICPYRDKPWNGTTWLTEKGDTILCFGKETKQGTITGCVAAYPKKKYKDSDLEGHEKEIMRRHRTYIMMECPLEVEHMVCELAKGVK